MNMNNLYSISDFSVWVKQSNYRYVKYLNGSSFSYLMVRPIFNLGKIIDYVVDFNNLGDLCDFLN